MKIRIFVVGTDEVITNFVNLKKTSLVPDEYRAEEGHVFAVSAIRYIELVSEEHLCEAFMGAAANFDAVVSIWDVRLSNTVSKFGEALFNVKAHFDSHSKPPQNQFRSILAKSLREFFNFSRLFDDAKYMKCFLLPIANFDACELIDLRDVLGRGNRSHPVVAALEAILAALRRRQFPKKFKRYKLTCLMDDHDRWFEYGPEIHKRRDTKIPPHNPHCNLNGHLRFGRSYDTERHFNVSREKPDRTVSRIFTDCHGERLFVQDVTHLNMFPNGFF